MRVQPATDEERKHVTALLRANDLPASDLGASPIRLFVGVDGEEELAVGGYEKYGTDGLLRSIVVPEAKRNRDTGQRSVSDSKSGQPKRESRRFIS